MNLGRIKRYVEMKQLQGHGYIFGDSGPTILHIPFTLNHIRPMEVSLGKLSLWALSRQIVSKPFWGNPRHQQHLSAPFSCPDYASTTELTHGLSNGCMVLPHICTGIYMHELLRLLFGFSVLSMFSTNPT